MIIAVTKTHIVQGQKKLNNQLNSRKKKQYRGDTCPVACALKDQLGVKNVFVSLSRATINGHQYDLPNAVSDFILAADEGKRLKPFAFKI